MQVQLVETNANAKAAVQRSQHKDSAEFCSQSFCLQNKVGRSEFPKGCERKAGRTRNLSQPDCPSRATKTQSVATVKTLVSGDDITIAELNKKTSYISD